MSHKDIKAYKDIFDKRNSQYTSNFNYANGKNPTIIDKQVQKEPDNRIPIPLAKQAVTDMAGYAGRAGDTKIKILDDSITEDQQKEYAKLLVEISEHNKGDLETAELYEEALTQGVAYELFWTSTDLKLRTVTPEYKIVSALEILPIYTNALKPTLSKAVRFWTANDEDFADVYEPEFVTHWIKVKDSETWAIDTNQGIEGITEYPYKSVPLSIYPINRIQQSLFEAEKPIIDAHDSIISKSSNEIDRFNAMIMLLPGKVTKEFVKKANEMRLIDDLGTDSGKWPEYLEKDLSGVNDYTNQLLDRLERQFHKSIKIPDMTAEAFAGGAQSGIAISYKLIGMEFKASQIDTYFDQGLNKRIELINDVLESSYAYVKDVKVKVTHKRNLPVDENAKAELALKLKGNISDEAYYRIFPSSIIPNVEEEMERRALLPDMNLLLAYEISMKSGKPVPSGLIADALRIERTEWDKLTAKDQKQRIDSLTADDDKIEKDLIDNDNL